MATKKKVAAEVTMEPKFSKESLINSKRFRHQRDVASAVLADGEEYTITEVEVMIAEYMKGKVK